MNGPKKPTSPPTRRSIPRVAPPQSAPPPARPDRTGFLTVWSQTIKDIVIRQIGYSTDNNKVLQDKINADLPFKIEMTATDGNTLISRADAAGQLGHHQ